MSLVAAYGSDSEGEDTTPALGQGTPSLPPKQGPTAPTASKAASGDGGASLKRADTGGKKRKKKKAKVLVSILPPEIQAALARGASLGGGDSDDEDDVDKEEAERVKRLRVQAAAAKAQGASKVKGSGLFALLPKPKAEQDMESMLSKAAEKKGDVDEKPPEKRAAPVAPTSREEDSEDDSDEEEEDEEEVNGEAGSEDNKKVEGVEAPSAGAASGSGPQVGAVGHGQDKSGEKDDEDDDDDDDDDEGGGLLHPSLLKATPAAPSPLPRPSVTLAPRVSAAPPVPAPSVPASTAAALPNMDATAAAAYASYAGAYQQQGQYDPASLQYYQQQQHGYPGGYDPQQAYYLQQQQQQQAALFAQQQQQEEEDQDPGSSKNRRRKKELQRELAAGNLDVLQKVGDGQVKEVAAYQEKWNPFAQGAVTQTEKVRVASSVYNAKTGETVQTFEASKTHKRKHQINTLAQQAAERELEILEGKHKSMLTKAQTQSKYGW